MRVARQWHLEGETIKNSEIYKLLDNTELNNLIVSSTTLYPSKETRGHSHEDQEEVYMFTRGEGTITIHSQTCVKPTGSISLYLFFYLFASLFLSLSASLSASLRGSLFIALASFSGLVCGPDSFIFNSILQLL